MMVPNALKFIGFCQLHNFRPIIAQWVKENPTSKYREVVGADKVTVRLLYSESYQPIIKETPPEFVPPPAPPAVKPASNAAQLEETPDAEVLVTKGKPKEQQEVIEIEEEVLDEGVIGEEGAAKHATEVPVDGPVTQAGSRKNPLSLLIPL